MASEPNDSGTDVGDDARQQRDRAMKLPFTDGSIDNSRLVTLPPISFEVRSTSGVSADSNGFSQRADAQLHVDCRRPSEIEADVSSVVFGKAAQLRRELIHTR